MNRWLFLAALHGFLAVAAGAFAAHGLSGRLDPVMLHAFETGARYEMFGGLALLALAFPAARPEGAGLKAPLNLLFWGTCLFSFSLYALALSGLRWLGFVTPLGGLGMLAGWAGLAWKGLKTSGRG